jgi:hypothetical protein
MVGAYLAGWEENVEESDILVLKYLEMEWCALHGHHDWISRTGGKSGS